MVSVAELGISCLTQSEGKQMGDKKLELPTDIPTRADALQFIQREINRHAMGYYLWFMLYVLLGTASIALPAVAALGIWDNKPYGTMFAGLGSIVAAVFAFLKPHEYASGYDFAVQTAINVKASFFMGRITSVEAAALLNKANEAVIFKYAGLK
jgi:hypothetical protein